ncbi:MAG TPA: hypothetical protein VMC06_02280 [Opitutaceae bacterium]|nr:hypothetical protein [Opitutaceae bacterium]
MNMPHLPTGQLKQLLNATDILVTGAQDVARAAKKKYREATRQRRGSALHPGPDTPLWNELAAAALKLLKEHGEKANLARYLGVSRQRVHLLLVAKAACPDAERALQLLAWVNARRAGRYPG